MASKPVTKMLTSTDFVTSSVETNTEVAVKEFAAEFAQTAAEKVKAEESLRYCLGLVARRMKSSVTELLTADDLLQLERGDDAGISDAREAARADVSTEIVELREVGTAALGPVALRELGLAGETPQGAPELARLATQVIKAFEAKPAWPTKIRGLTLRAADYVPDLRTKGARLEAAMATSNKDLRENQKLMIARDELQARHVRIFSRGARFIEAALRIAGLEELADRVRPSGRTPGTVDEPAPAATEPAPLA